ncbi:apolipoprotein L2-like [Nannospalax galili]|uniref:apolipoprotein L2-like n=1 Tax=Nannospalax galili TaxID=1026970 RepID=UPI00111C8A28|nr:apolipoprotein L2-like [Nannospalax galili]XP_029412876.1 apolipoprotein L2-like [Nannospalax galili]
MASRVLRKCFMQRLIERLQDMESREDLQLLLTKDEHWNALVVEAELSRDEEATLRKAVKELIELIAVEDKDRLQKELQEKERFLKAFPGLKKKLEAYIRKLRALADHIAKVHRACTISSVVTGATSTVSGVLSLLGIVLAPVTAGASLVLSATGLGLGISASLTSTATTLVEETSRWSDEAEARHMVSLTIKIIREIVAIGKITFKLSSGIYNIKNMNSFIEHIHAIRMTIDNPHLVADARILGTTGELCAEQATQVPPALKGTALAMTKTARITGTVTASLSLVVDVCFLIKDSVHLHDGAKSESAETLQKMAQKLEENLRELDQIHKTLQSDKP